ncbi:MAG: rhomboid family intramembrane serine protease, partial [Chloroflexi bacterium]|nr:rhomboid family intramembrane serine protease [Chloroflexota bacterium]
MFPLQDNVRSRDFPLVNWLLIAANVLVFLFESSLGPQQLERFVMTFGLVPARFFAQEGWMHPMLALTALTSMFMHGGWMHLGGNMLFLW